MVWTALNDIDHSINYTYIWICALVSRCIHETTRSQCNLRPPPVIAGTVITVKSNSRMWISCDVCHFRLVPQTCIYVATDHSWISSTARSVNCPTSGVTHPQPTSMLALGKVRDAMYYLMWWNLRLSLSRIYAFDTLIHTQFSLLFKKYHSVYNLIRYWSVQNYRFDNLLTLSHSSFGEH